MIKFFIFSKTCLWLFLKFEGYDDIMWMLEELCLHIALMFFVMLLVAKYPSYLKGNYLLLWCCICVNNVGSTLIFIKSLETQI